MGNALGGVMMERFYRDLPWLSIEQALDYLRRITKPELVLSEQGLLQLGRSRRVDVYVEIDPRGLTGTASDTKEKVTLIGMQQVLNPDMAFEPGWEQTCAVLKYGDAHWIGLLPSWSQKALFKSADIEALAARINDKGEQPDTAELEDLRRQLQQAMSEVEALKLEREPEPEKPIEIRERATLERLVYVLAKEAKYQLASPHADEASIKAAAEAQDIKGLSGKGTIAKYLSAAALRIKQDQQR